jgi:hypothetical protein
MNETIRDVIKRRVRRLYAISLAGWVAFMITRIMGPKSGWTPLTIAEAAVLLVPLGIVKFVKCPKCSKPLGQIASAVALPWRRDPAYCPHCGVSLDDPMPHKIIS